MKVNTEGGSFSIWSNRVKALAGLLCLLVAVSPRAETEWQRLDIITDTSNVTDTSTVSEQQQALQKIATALAASVPIQGRLVQEKHLSLLDAPMVSEGEFSLAKNGDIVWNIHTPFAVGYSVQDQIIWRTLDGQREKITARSEPSVFGFFHMLGRLFALRLDALAEYFYIDVPQSGLQENWQLRLMPKNALLQKAIGSILAEGSSNQMQRVTIVSPNGDATHIQFFYASNPGE